MTISGLRKASIRILLIISCIVVREAFAASPPLPPERFFGINLIQTGGGWPYDKGAWWLNAGTSFSLINYPAFGGGSNPLPLFLSADYSYSPHMAVGPYLGYLRVTYTDFGTLNRRRFVNYHIGARWLFHGTDYLNDLFGFGLDIRQFDLYTGLSAGLDIQLNSDENPDKSFSQNPSRTNTRLGLIFGAKYLLKQRIGFYAEAGYGTFGVFNFGLCFKLKEKS